MNPEPNAELPKKRETESLMWCIGCRRHVTYLVIGDWYPSWALCESCAANVEGRG